MNDEKKQPMQVQIKQGPAEWVKTALWGLLAAAVVYALFFQPARLIKVFNEEDVPVVVYASSLLASGGYYMAATADAIYAAPQAMMGSIGVLFQTVNARKLVEDKLGVQIRVFKEDRYKDMGNPFKELT